MNENDLMNKLLISKKIMEKHQAIPRNTNDGSGLLSSNTIDVPSVQSFDSPNASYNIPQEFMQENVAAKIPKYVNNSERIMSSKLPDAIKQLMIEHPIQQPDSTSGPVLSDELIEKASRLMNNSKTNSIQEVNYKSQNNTQSTQSNQDLKSLLKEVVEEVLMENGILSESTTKSNEVFSFKVGKHIFEGKLLKIKKLK
jgi:hypothetical protein